MTVIPIILCFFIIAQAMRLDSNQFMMQQDIFKRLEKVLDLESRKFEGLGYFWTKGYHDLWIELVKK